MHYDLAPAGTPINPLDDLSTWLTEVQGTVAAAAQKRREFGRSVWTHVACRAVLALARHDQLTSINHSPSMELQ